jgi:hypothetical protein
MNASQNKLVRTDTKTTSVKWHWPASSASHDLENELRQSFERRNETKLCQQQICILVNCRGHYRYKVNNFTVTHYKPVHQVPRTCVKELLVVLLTNFTHFFNVFISLLYMFRATQCSSPGESIVSIHHLVRSTATYTEWCIPGDVLTQLILLVMSTGLLETCRDVK